MIHNSLLVILYLVFEQKLVFFIFLFFHMSIIQRRRIEMKGDENPILICMLLAIKVFFMVVSLLSPFRWRKVLHRDSKHSLWRRYYRPGKAQRGQLLRTFRIASLEWIARLGCGLLHPLLWLAMNKSVDIRMER